MAELPYPSWALIPELMKLARAHVNCSVCFFVWYDMGSQRPVAAWFDPVNEKAYYNWITNYPALFEQVLPSGAFIESRGRVVRELENAPGYEDSFIYTQVHGLHQARWHMAIPITLGESMFGFMCVARGKAEGPYTEEEWQCLDCVGQALQGLDRQPHPWADLPSAPMRECFSTMLWLARDGRFLAQGRYVREVLFLARQTGLGSPDWIHPDWRALPPEVRSAAMEMFAEADSVDASRASAHVPAQRSVSLRFQWGCFDFLLNDQPATSLQPESTAGIAIRHQQPIDIMLARNLWGWPLSPRQKRLLIVSTRQPSMAQLAAALELTVGTAKFYLSEIKTHLGVKSRQDLVEWILDTPYDEALQQNHQNEG